MQQRLKTPPGTAGARVVATQLLEEIFGPSHHPVAALDARLGWEAFSALTRDLESTRLRVVYIWFAWGTSIALGIEGARII